MEVYSRISIIEKQHIIFFFRSVMIFFFFDSLLVALNSFKRCRIEILPQTSMPAAFGAEFDRIYSFLKSIHFPTEKMINCTRLI